MSRALSPNGPKSSLQSSRTTWDSWCGQESSPPVGHLGPSFVTCASVQSQNDSTSSWHVSSQPNQRTHWFLRLGVGAECPLSYLLFPCIRLEANMLVMCVWGRRWKGVVYWKYLSTILSYRITLYWILWIWIMSKEEREYRVTPCYHSQPVENRRLLLKAEVVMSHLPDVLHVLAHNGISIITKSMNKLVKISPHPTEYIL